MSTKSSIICLPCVHIYDDCIGSNGGNTLCIDVDYDYVGDDLDCIEVDGNSDFAKLIRYLLKGKTEEDLIKAIKGNQNEGDI